jgi:hypothetical protein
VGYFLPCGSPQGSLRDFLGASVCTSACPCSVTLGDEVCRPPSPKATWTYEAPCLLEIASALLCPVGKQQHRVLVVPWLANCKLAESSHFAGSLGDRLGSHW